MALRNRLTLMAVICAAILVGSVAHSAKAHGPRSAHERHVESAVRNHAGIDALVFAAREAQGAHRFEEALALLAQATDRDPHHDNAWLLTSSIRLVRGETEAAANACRRLRRLPAIVIVTCSAQVLTAAGEAARALSRLEAALAVGTLDDVPADVVAWIYSSAGDAARPGDAALAERYYRMSLRQRENEQVRAALVDLLLNTGQVEAAEQVLAAPFESFALHVLDLLVQKARGRDTAHDAAHLDQRFRAFVAAGDYTHAREMARFYLDVSPSLEQARVVSRENLRLQREPEDLNLHRRIEAMIQGAAL